MDQLIALQSKLTSDCDKIEKLEMKIKNEIITLTKARGFNIIQSLAHSLFHNDSIIPSKGSRINKTSN